MEPHPRTPPGPHRLRPLNTPVVARVEADELGIPRAVLLRGAWRRVTRVEEAWRIDDGWWRPTPIARMYYRLSLEPDHLLTVYRDDRKGEWWSQRY
jgi:hypothetical protein